MKLILPFLMQALPRLTQVRRRTWLILAGVIAACLVLFFWLAVSIFGWLWGQAQSLTGTLPDTARALMGQIEQAAPGVREKLSEVVPALNDAPPPREVSGADIGPVARYQGLVRVSWQHDGERSTVSYQGEANYAAVLDHYVKGFAAQGYTQTVLSAQVDGEKHEYRQHKERVSFMLEQLPNNKVKVTLTSLLPASTHSKTGP